MASFPLAVHEGGPFQFFGGFVAHALDGFFHFSHGSQIGEVLDLGEPGSKVDQGFTDAGKALEGSLDGLRTGDTTHAADIEGDLLWNHLVAHICNTAGNLFDSDPAGIVRHLQLAGGKIHARFRNPGNVTNGSLNGCHAGCAAYSLDS